MWLSQLYEAQKSILGGEIPSHEQVLGFRGRTWRSFNVGILPITISFEFFPYIHNIYKGIMWITDTIKTCFFFPSHHSPMEPSHLQKECLRQNWARHTVVPGVQQAWQSNSPAPLLLCWVPCSLASRNTWSWGTVRQQLAWRTSLYWYASFPATPSEACWHLPTQGKDFSLPALRQSGQQRSSQYFVFSFPTPQRYIHVLLMQLKSIFNNKCFKKKNTLGNGGSRL